MTLEWLPKKSDLEQEEDEEYEFYRDDCEYFDAEGVSQRKLTDKDINYFIDWTDKVLVEQDSKILLANDKIHKLIQQNSTLVLAIELLKADIKELKEEKKMRWEADQVCIDLKDD